MRAALKRGVHDVLCWRGKDVRTMTRDELESALRESCVLYSDLLEEQRRRGLFTADMMRLAARAIPQ